MRARSMELLSGPVHLVGGLPREPVERHILRKRLRGRRQLGAGRQLGTARPIPRGRTAGPGRRRTAGTPRRPPRRPDQARRPAHAQARSLCFMFVWRLATGWPVADGFGLAQARVVFLWSALMILSYFSSRGWESWDVACRPLLPERMPVLIDDDLRFEDGPGAPRPATVVSRWLRELPASGCPAPGSWESYARTVNEWMAFLAGHGVWLFDSRQQLKAALGKYAGHPAAGPVQTGLAATHGGQHVSILSLFYRWAMEEGHAEAEPFSYRTARALFAGTGREVRANLAVRRTPKPHVTVKYLEPDFTRLFLNGLCGLAPDGGPDDGYRGRELARNAAIGQLALSTGLRLQEFSYLLAYEIPALPPKPSQVPIPFPVPAGVSKGRKFRIAWISYEALAAVHHYLELDRPATTEGTGWVPQRRRGHTLR